MHFLLWTKGSHENTNFDTFKCSDENLPNSSCHFPNHKLFLLQILHDSSMQCHELLLLRTFLDQTLYTWHKKDQSKCKFFRLLSARIKIHQIFVIFETKNRFFFKFCTTLQYHETVESLKFCTLVGYFCKNHITFQLKKCRRLFSHDIEERCKY